ncbi:MAG: hypothetical protein NWE98_09330 [Candidatus Bathyarchaeota archaeon]|nr:hypothetical protein [Candidatus Bathyarchaeota archaeon]
MAVGLIICIIGAIMFVFGGIAPAINGAAVNMPIIVFGVILIIVAGMMEVLVAKS